jgi:hypothetical protein
MTDGITKLIMPLLTALDLKLGELAPYKPSYSREGRRFYLVAASSQGQIAAFVMRQALNPLLDHLLDPEQCTAKRPADK